MRITTTYTIILDGKESTYTETRDVENRREAHYLIMYSWYGVDKIVFHRDVIEF